MQLKMSHKIGKKKRKNGLEFVQGMQGFIPSLLSFCQSPSATLLHGPPVTTNTHPHGFD
jgi:hypothetical protein